MKKFQFVLAMVGWALVASSSQAQAQRGTVAMLDMNQIFEKYTGFTQLKADMEASVAAAEKNMKQRSDRLVQWRESLSKMQQGSAQFQQLDDQITKETTNVRLEFTQIRRKFAKQEAQIMHQTYKEIINEVAMYCQRAGIQLVLQFKSEPLSDTDHQEVFGRIQHPVVYAGRSIDITQVILNQLNQRHAARGGGRSQRR